MLAKVWKFLFMILLEEKNSNGMFGADMLIFERIFVVRYL